jgi:TrpR family transcriptional regulator, trp operon repressor
MPDKQPLDIEAVIEELSSVLAGVDDPDLVRRFLYSILTEYEIEEVASRWELVKLIDRGMSQRKIADRLGLSLCKITRGSKELKKENSAFKQVIDRI